MSLRYVLRRLALLIPVVLCIAAMNFALLHLAPGDAAEIIAGQSGHGSKEFGAELRKDCGLDKPLVQQFFIFAYKLFSFDLGYSYVQSTPVASLIAERLPATLLLMVSGGGAELPLPQLGFELRQHIQMDRLRAEHRHVQRHQFQARDRAQHLLHRGHDPGQC